VDGVDQEEYVERVLAVVERIPPGRVMSYGAIAEAVGVGGPRQVGRVMSLDSGGMPWWRVVRADGGLPDCHGGEALSHHRAEGTPLRASGRVDMAAASWWPPHHELLATGSDCVGPL
jgi:alkylated DNA nucleotide flippase Atl1